MNEDEDDDDDTGSVRIRLVDDQHQPTQFAAYYGNTRLSAHFQDGSEEAVGQKSVYFSPETTVFSAVDDASEDPYAYDDDILRITRDVIDDDVDDITIFPELIL